SLSLSLSRLSSYWSKSLKGNTKKERAFCFLLLMREKEGNDILLPTKVQVDNTIIPCAVWRVQNEIEQKKEETREVRNHRTTETETMEPQEPQEPQKPQKPETTGTTGTTETTEPTET